jgi:hypothetical protein
MVETGTPNKTSGEKNPKSILMQAKYQVNRPMTILEASDEIISIFCEIHGGVEAAMPMIAYQFKKEEVDFANPTKEGLTKVAMGLVKVTEFLKGKELAELEEKRFNHLIKMINP